MAITLVEHAEADETGDSVRTALYLCRLQGASQVLLAGPRRATTSELLEIEKAGLPMTARVEGNSGVGEALLDVWTSECDERVVRLREQGVLTSCLADLVLTESGERVVGITGSAGKTTTAWLTRQLLAALCLRPDSVCSSEARASNLWPTSRLLGCPDTSLIVAELTSSHLAFCHRSARVAAITNFWPDHIELHGSLEAYRAAKARLFRWQGPGDIAVLPFDDPVAAQVGAVSAGGRAWFGEGEFSPSASDTAVWFDSQYLHLSCPAGHCREALPLHWNNRTRRALAAALAISLATAQLFREHMHDDLLPRLLAALPGLALPPHRGEGPGRVVDNTLAATPRKAAAALQPGIRLVAGGMNIVAARAVHTSPEEQQALQDWLALIPANCLSVDLFGPAGERMAQKLNLPLSVHAEVGEALRAALGRGGTDPVVVAPGFPMLQSDREVVAGYSLGESV